MMDDTKVINPGVDSSNINITSNYNVSTTTTTNITYNGNNNDIVEELDLSLDSNDSGEDNNS